MEQKNDTPLSFRYRFKSADKSVKTFDVHLDPGTLCILDDMPDHPPDWTKIDVERCPGCPFQAEECRYCPVAVRLSVLIGAFKESISYEEVDVTIAVQERAYAKHTTLQNGLASLIGIYMATGGCPILDHLKPMVRFHLPFASLEETMYRSLSMYLLAQYFVMKKGGEPDWQMKKLPEIYEQIGRVNEAFCRRIKHAVKQDANVNAVVVLDIFASSIRFSIMEDVLNDLEGLFGPYLREIAAPNPSPDNRVP